MSVGHMGFPQIRGTFGTFNGDYRGYIVTIWGVILGF